MWIKEAKIYYKVVMKSVLEFRYYYYDPNFKRFIFLGSQFCFEYDRVGYKRGTPKVLFKRLRSHIHTPTLESDLDKFFISDIPIYED